MKIIFGKNNLTMTGHSRRFIYDNSIISQWQIPFFFQVQVIYVSESSFIPVSSGMKIIPTFCRTNNSGN